MKPTRTITVGPAASSRNALQAAYARVDDASAFEPAPSWAFKLPATIPFVGARYGESADAPRILLYASAEHVGTAEKDSAPWLRPGQPGATDRHAVAWRGGWPGVAAHTRVGIAPYEDGPLLTAAALLWRWELTAEHTNASPPSDPVELTERIAVANFSKFAVPPKGPGRTNVDASAERILRDSLPYVFADIDALQPSLVLVAKALTPALLNEVTAYAAHRGAFVVYTIQGSGQGPKHAATHLERMGASDAFDLRAALGEAFDALWAFPGRRKDLTKDMWTRWLALLKARYATATLARKQTQRSPR